MKVKGTTAPISTAAISHKKTPPLSQTAEPATKLITASGA